ncbi:MAG: S1 RNA-binding domain-containing protein [Candidatus Komeilibacteria bacterium]
MPTKIPTSHLVTKGHPMDELLKQQDLIKVPKPGELVEGTVLSVSKNEVYLDLDGMTTGVIRGKEMEDESGESASLQIGDRTSAMVVDLENERGEVELSFRMAGHQKAWDRLEKLMRDEQPVEARVIDANKGGLMVKVGNVIGFLPVSQLTTENYPRIEGGDKNKILAYLKTFVNKVMKTKIIDVDEKDEKLIVSEKAAWDEKQRKALSGYKVGDTIKGTITGVVDFGAFIEFGDGLEGLIHISELAWQRIDDPKTIVKVGDIVEAEIISLDDTKVSLSMKKLKDDPWKDVEKKYKIGDKVTGKVLKLNPFGAFVELDQDIHGLAHISELSEKPIKSPDEAVHVGESYDFRVITIEAKDHRLGLSLRPPRPPKIKKEITQETAGETTPPIETTPVPVSETPTSDTPAAA